MPQFVRLVNVDTRPFDFHARNAKRVVPVGGETIVPWDLAITLFGDPFSVDEPRSPERTMALKRCRAVWGYMDGLESMEEFEARRTHVEVWDIETSPFQRIHMLIEDPEGMLSAEYAPDNGEQDMVAMLTQRMAVMQAQIERLINSQAGAALPSSQTVIPSNDAAPIQLPGTMSQQELAEQAERARVMAQFGGVPMPDDTAAPVQVVEVHAAATGELANAPMENMSPEQRAIAGQLAMAQAAERAAQTLQSLKQSDALGIQDEPPAVATVDGPTPPAASRLAPRPASMAS